MSFLAGSRLTAQALNRAIPKRITLDPQYSTGANNTTLGSTALTLTLEANRKYLWTLKGLYTAPTGADLKTGLVIPTGASLAYEANSLESGATTATGPSYRGVFTSTTGPIIGGIGGSTPASFTLAGAVFTGANAGPFTLQVAQNNNDLTAAILLAGSWLEMLDAT